MRIELFNKLIKEIDQDNDFYIKKLIKKLKTSDLILIQNFITFNDWLGKSDFEYKLNRLLLDKPTKPKRWKEITEILLTLNIRATYEKV